MIRIAFVITELSYGGAEKAFFQLISGLDRTRFEPIVYVLSGKERDLKNSLAPLFRDEGLEVVELGIKSVLDLPKAFCRFCRLLKKQAPHVLQSFMFHANLLGRFAARASGVPIVCSGVRVAERDSRWRVRLDRLTGSLVDAWVCVGESVANFTRTVGGAPASRVVSIPNGVHTVDGAVAIGRTNVVDALKSVASSDVSASLPRGFGKRKRLVGIGRLTIQKGFDFLLETAPRWLTEEVAREWELWIVGDGEERERLERQTRELGLEGFVYFTGWRADASRILAESELFLLPSRWEGMPNALLEAAALGKPTLCADVEGVAEILGADVSEQICPSGDAETWSRKISALLGDENLRRTLGERNRTRVLTEFTDTKVNEKHVALWTRLLKEKGVETN